ncbi:MAG: ABC transporter substrate-binding protein [Alphaproteobacteria bacterium]|nr:ABC transporter substrate-binding protein [Alphaproteobacteria bacterium]
MKNLYRFLLCFILVLIGGTATAQDKVLKIYHDADYTKHTESAHAMEMGFKTALDEIGNKIQGYKIEFVPKDHRGNAVRSKLHMDQFLEDPQALFILGGLHSPPYIKYKDFINESGILLMVPWAAGGPITRYNKGTNWVFRLSVDDTKAGYRIAEYAQNDLGCKNPHLLLEETPWGQSNKKTMTKALEKNGSPQVTWFGWNTKENTAKIMLRDIVLSGSDCILFVGNAVEGAEFSRAMLSLEEKERLPIISHWGITGGDFHEVISPEMREGLGLHFIQSCFSFVSSPQTELSNSVFARAQKLYPDQIKKAEDIPAPPGFIHAYDLGHITLAALGQIKLTGDVKVDRTALRTALESLNAPVEGLIKTYKAPFSPWTSDHDDAHEALGLDDFCMAQYGPENQVFVKANMKGNP